MQFWSLFFQVFLLMAVAEIGPGKQGSTMCAIFIGFVLYSFKEAGI